MNEEDTQRWISTSVTSLWRTILLPPPDVYPINHKENLVIFLPSLLQPPPLNSAIGRLGSVAQATSSQLVQPPDAFGRILSEINARCNIIFVRFFAWHTSRDQRTNVQSRGVYYRLQILEDYSYIRDERFCMNINTRCLEKFLQCLRL